MLGQIDGISKIGKKNTQLLKESFFPDDFEHGKQMQI